MDIHYETVTQDDFLILLELRIRAMQESLENLGRFNREHCVERFRDSFEPENTRTIHQGDELVGFYAVTEKEDHLYLNHLYIKSDFQSSGLGSAIMADLIELSKKRNLPLRLGALRESRANKFYQRHGFVVISQTDWDIFYERAYQL